MRDKTESSAPNTGKHSLPFFARFLEGQERSKGPDRTLKFPSDSDEWIVRTEYTPATTDCNNK
jgi:hypothetical protein